MTVRPNKKFGFQSAAENLQRRRQPDRLRQTVPERCMTSMISHQGSRLGEKAPNGHLIWQLLAP